MHSLAQIFLSPRNPNHRQYEALRAHFVDGLPPTEAASRFGYSLASFRNLCRDLRNRPDRHFFLPSRPGRKPDRQQPAVLRRNERILELRRQQGLSVLEIADQLARESLPASKSAIARVLQQAGIPKLPRRSPAQIRAARPLSAPTADRRLLDLSPRSFHTPYGGLFLFADLLARLPLSRFVDEASLPGSALIPARCALLALLALKLYDISRKSHVAEEVCDPGLALFAGLNAIPKRSTLAEYSARIDPGHGRQLARLWLDALHDRADLPRGDSFDLDFHAIPFHGDDPQVEKHYISKRSRSQKSILAFVARDATARVFCYANANVPRKDRQAEITSFAEDWHERYDGYPGELVFDSTLTNRTGLARLTELDIDFLTLRRRTKQVLAAVQAAPPQNWRRLTLSNIGRRYRRPNTLDQRVALPNYPGTIRQIAVTDIGHQKPMLLLTNQLDAPLAPLVDRYARRMLIENALSEAIDFFHCDALSSQVALKVDIDLQLTVMASSLYRCLGRTLGGGYATARARTLFRKFVKASARVQIESGGIEVRIGRRAHNPILLQAGFADKKTSIPWLRNRELRLTFL